MQRLGIFGGTFNPPHSGHIYIATEAKIGANLDNILFIPCGNPPHKTVDGNVAAKHRFEMTRLAISDTPDFEISDIEVKSKHFSYTSKTLEKLKVLYPDKELCLVVGGDSLRDMEEWHCPKKIFALSEIIALRRGGMDSAVFNKSLEFYKKKYKAKLTVVDVLPLEMSSSDIRRMIKSGEDVSKVLDARVLSYIEKFGIYREND